MSILIVSRFRNVLIGMIVLGSMLCLMLVSIPTAVASEGKDIVDRVAKLEAKEEIRTTVHAFINAINSSFISGETNPLWPIVNMLHPEIVLSATPPRTPFDPTPTPLVFSGIYQVLWIYGQVVVANVKPNVVASSIDVRMLDQNNAGADLRLVTSVTVPTGCAFGAPGCSQTLLFADAFMSFKRDTQQTWQISNVDLVHYIAHGTP